MTVEEKFVFDLEGYIVIKNVLTAAEIAELNDLTDRNFKTYPYGEEEQGRVTSLLSWANPVKHLIDHRRILPYLIGLLAREYDLTITTAYSCAKVTGAVAFMEDTADLIGIASVMALWRTD